MTAHTDLFIVYKACDECAYPAAYAVRVVSDVFPEGTLHLLCGGCAAEMRANGVSVTFLRRAARALRPERHRTEGASCRNGHPWTESNTYHAFSGNGYRQCRTCVREANSRARSRKRAARHSMQQEAVAA